ncbi:MAG: AAA family ATPase [Myxococcales bacterium]
MKLSKLEGEYFRGFAKLSLEFDPSLTVLVGVNGSGKTSILECLSILLSQLPSQIGATGSRRFSDSDIHAGVHFACATLSASILGEQVSWTLAHNRKGYPSQATSHLQELKRLAARVQQQNKVGAWNLPLAMYYPVNRAILEPPQRIKVRHEFSELSSYDGALSGGSANFRLFFEWFREREDLENEHNARHPKDHRSDPQLAAVRKAIESMLPGFSDLHIQRKPHRMVLSKNGHVLELNQLSDGEKCLLAMVGDLARRLALANPASSNPLSTEAVVLIDEIELHLHPAWQRSCVRLLRSTFPGCQFILTTHSPQVLSEVPASAVRLLDGFQLYRPDAQTLGRDSNAILSEVMGTAERPELQKQQIHTIAQLIDEGELGRARDELEKLAESVSDRDSDVVRLRSTLRFLELPSDAHDPQRQ